MNATMANYKVPSEEARVVTKENTIGLPPGFRFHPTDEEIVVHYLIPKVTNSEFSAAPIGQAHFNKCEPWDLPEIGNMGNTEERYYFFQRDKKYSTGLRTNRATKAGYWKATGKDVEIYISSGDRRDPIGMKKTLVFYMGRAPRGGKTNWIMHEYRLLHQFTLIPKNDGWVVSRVLHKNAGDGDGDGMHKKPYSGKDSSFSLNLGSNGSLSTDNLIKDDDFESLPPLIDPSAAPDDAPQFQDLKPKPVVLISEGLLHKAINMPAKMWPPSSSIFDAYDEDQLIYAHDPSYYYPTFSETLLQKPDPLGFEQPMAENNVVGSVMENYNCKFEQHFASSAGIGFSHASQISSSAMTNNNNKNLEMAANDQETNELLPSTKGLSKLWDYYK